VRRYGLEFPGTLYALGDRGAFLAFCGKLEEARPDPVRDRHRRLQCRGIAWQDPVRTGVPCRYRRRQRRNLRRRPRIRRVPSRDSRGASSAGSPGGDMSPRPARDAQPRPGRRDRSGRPRLSPLAQQGRRARELERLASQPSCGDSSSGYSPPSEVKGGGRYAPWKEWAAGGRP
jgi:hypothetical protein